MIFLTRLFWDYSATIWENTPPGRYVLRAVAEGNYQEALIAFQKWHKARPKLYVSQDQYATDLVLAMIDACERIALYTFFSEERGVCEQTIETLKKMLERPPPRDPTPSPATAGLVFI